MSSFNFLANKKLGVPEKEWRFHQESTLSTNPSVFNYIFSKRKELFPLAIPPGGKDDSTNALNCLAMLMIGCSLMTMIRTVKGQERSLFLTLQSFQIMKWLVLLKWICILILDIYAFLD